MKLEITKKLEDMADELDSSIAILNLPAANICEKRAEFIELPNGQARQSCEGCITQEIISNNMMSMDKIKRIIDYFAEKYHTKFITIPGRGNPFHPRVREETLEKIRYALSKGIQAYIFNAGNGLTKEVCQELAQNGTNVMMSLLGNPFIDSDFFVGKKYPSANGKWQNQERIAENFRTLINAYRENPNQPAQNTTRLGMNYIVTEKDLEDDGKRLNDLRIATNQNRIFLVSNTEFDLYTNQLIKPEVKEKIRKLTFGHSTSVNGQCQMGAGSSATVDSDGTLYRCPYMSGVGNGNILRLSNDELEKVLFGYNTDRSYSCVMRKTPRSNYERQK